MWLNIAIIAAVLIFFSVNKRYRWFYIFVKTLPRDVRFIFNFTILQIKLRSYQKRNTTVTAEFFNIARKNPQNVAFYFEDEKWTYSQLEHMVNQVSRYFKQQGFKKGDSIGLFLENRPEYICIWLGLSHIGVLIAFINTNLTKDPFIHCMTAANCKAIIYGSNYAKVIQDVMDKVSSAKLYQFHEIPTPAKDVLPGTVDLRHELKGIPSGPFQNTDNINVNDPLLYIYTSGTTGLPKAAVMTHLRYLTLASVMIIMGKLKKDDALYVCLPFYHTAGGAMGTGVAIVHGIKVAMRKKFSASSYWSDCQKYKCTHAQYIGEMCRYILAAPQNTPVKHSVRIMIGNGLKPQIWSQFVKKFGIKQVIEYYGATEGVSSLINIDNQVGSVGFMPTILKRVYPISLIKCNQITGEPIRNENGRCIKCEINEPGLIIGKIDEKLALSSYKGYRDDSASKSKVLHNVFSEGDNFFNSGDILTIDEFGYFYFVDRIGDTFRWKGENVSTTEVEAVISNLTNLRDAIVYGVEIPGTEGRAGMVTLADPENALNFDSIYKDLKTNIPAYAIPAFIRVKNSVPTTGTFKLQKYELQMEGYDIGKIQDSLYCCDAKAGKYVTLTKDLHQQIINGKHIF